MSSVNYKKEISTGNVRDWYVMGSGKLVDKAKEEYVWSQIKVEANNISRWFISKQQED